MKLRFHPSVQRDVNEALDCYAERSAWAADRFWAGLHDRLGQIVGNPKRFGFLDQARGLRHVRIPKFPYVIVYYESAAGVKVTCIKHVRRNPGFGLRRR